MMLLDRDPRLLLLIGFLLMLLGFVLPFLMVMGVVTSTLFLNFFSFTASLVGVVTGIIGVAFYARRRME
jgi:uncharacterized membrane protein